ncbi:MAG: phosphatidate cytidylyltransferase [Solirubrobacterales bacterium]
MAADRPPADAERRATARGRTIVIGTEAPEEHRPPAGGRRRGRRDDAGSSEGGGSGETLRRVVSALPWIAFALAIVILGGWWFAAGAVVLGVIGLLEFYGMTARAKPLAPAGIVVLAAALVVAHVSDRPPFHLLLVAAVGFAVLFGVALLERPPNGTYAMATTAFGVLWLGVPLAHAILLRDLEPHGGGLLIDVAVGAFLADTAAYAGGRAFGSRQLAPEISPGKTVEGLAFGIAGGTMAVALAGLYQDWMSFGESLVLGVTVATLAPLGDLFESYVKRDLEVKDSGRIVGAHGGLLDRIDGVMFSVVGAYYVVLAYGAFVGGSVS